MVEDIGAVNISKNVPSYGNLAFCLLIYFCSFCVQASGRDARLNERVLIRATTRTTFSKNCGGGGKIYCHAFRKVKIQGGNDKKQ
jgi:hypothetical protein